MKERAKEEKCLVVQEMNRTYCHFCLLHLTLQEVLFDNSGDDLYELGVHSLTLKNLLFLQDRLKCMYMCFSLHLFELPPPPLFKANNPDTEETTQPDEEVHNRDPAEAVLPEELDSSTVESGQHAEEDDSTEIDILTECFFDDVCS